MGARLRARLESVLVVGGGGARTRPRRRPVGGVALAVAALAWAGCGGEVTAPVECEVVDAYPIWVPGSEGALSPSVGLLDGKALVSWASFRDVGVPPLRLHYFAQWMDPETGEALGEQMRFGDSYGWRPRWVRYQGKLYGQVWAAFTPAGDLDGDRSAFLRRVEVPPPGEGPPVGELLERDLPETCADCGYPWAGWGFGEEGMLPIAVGLGGPWLATSQEPGECDFTSALLSQMRIHATTGATDLSLGPVRYGDDFCREEDDDIAAGNIWLVERDGEPPGVLFRQGLGPQALLHFGNLTEAGDAFEEPPRFVDAYDSYISADSGFQAKGVAVGDDRIVFSHRWRNTNERQLVRVMDGRGRNARDAAWQPSGLVRGVEWVGLPGAALAVWGWRTDIDQLVVTSTVEMEEEVRAAVINRNGRLASEVMRVSDPSATALDPLPRTETEGPYVNEFIVAADVEGETVAVVWNDKRYWAPGVYLQRLRCTPVTEEP